VVGSSREVLGAYKGRDIGRVNDAGYWEETINEVDGNRRGSQPQGERQGRRRGDVRRRSGRRAAFPSG